MKLKLDTYMVKFIDIFLFLIVFSVPASKINGAGFYFGSFQWMKVPGSPLGQNWVKYPHAIVSLCEILFYAQDYWIDPITGISVQANAVTFILALLIHEKQTRWRLVDTWANLVNAFACTGISFTVAIFVILPSWHVHNMPGKDAPGESRKCQKLRVSEEVKTEIECQKLKVTLSGFNFLWHFQFLTFTVSIIPSVSDTLQFPLFLPCTFMQFLTRPFPQKTSF